MLNILIEYYKRFNNYGKFYTHITYVKNKNVTLNNMFILRYVIIFNKIQDSNYFNKLIYNIILYRSYTATHYIFIYNQNNNCKNNNFLFIDTNVLGNKFNKLYYMH